MCSILYYDYVIVLEIAINLHNFCTKIVEGTCANAFKVFATK